MDRRALDKLVKSQLNRGTRRSVRDPLKRLPGALRPGERVMHVAAGLCEGEWCLLAATDWRLLILGPATDRTDDLGYEQIESVQLDKRRLERPRLVFAVAGGELVVEELSGEARSIRRYVDAQVSGRVLELGTASDEG